MPVEWTKECGSRSWRRRRRREGDVGVLPGTREKNCRWGVTTGTRLVRSARRPPYEDIQVDRDKKEIKKNGLGFTR